MSNVQAPTRPRRLAHLRASSWSLIALQSRSRREAYPRRDCRDLDAAHAVGAYGDQPLARGGRVGHERAHFNALTVRSEGPQTLDPLLQERGGAMEVAVAPVVEADADLEDPVVQAAHRCASVAPEELERLVLVEELAGVELLDAADQLWRRRLVAARACGLKGLTAGDAFGRPRRLAVAATRPWRAQGPRSPGSGARPRGTRAQVDSRTLGAVLPVDPQRRL